MKIIIDKSMFKSADAVLGLIIGSYESDISPSVQKLGKKKAEFVEKYGISIYVSGWDPGYREHGEQGYRLTCFGLEFPNLEVCFSADEYDCDTDRWGCAGHVAVWHGQKVLRSHSDKIIFYTINAAADYILELIESHLKTHLTDAADSFVEAHDA